VRGGRGLKKGTERVVENTKAGEKNQNRSETVGGRKKLGSPEEKTKHSLFVREKVKMNPSSKKKKQGPEGAKEIKGAAFMER